MQRRAVQTVEAIVQAAGQVFARRGYLSTTTDHIAERAGVSIGSLYQYFANKENVLAAVAEWQVKRTFDTLRAELDLAVATHNDPRRRLRRLVRATLALPMYEQEVHHLLFHQLVPPSMTKEHIQQGGQELIKQVAEMIAETPQARCADPWLSAYLIIHAVEGMVRSFVGNRPPGLEEEAFIEEVVEMLYLYLAGGGSEASAGLHKADLNDAEGR
jgi:AcrR family transcriptional regulator